MQIKSFRSWQIGESEECRILTDKMTMLRLYWRLRLQFLQRLERVLATILQRERQLEVSESGRLN